MKKYGILIQDSVYYEIEAETENEAVDKALDYWDERNPDIFIENEKESEE